MSDTTEVEVPDTTTTTDCIPTAFRGVVPYNSESGSAAAHIKAQTDRARKEENKKQSRMRAELVLGEATENAIEAASNRKLSLLTIEQLADLNTKRLLKVMVLGGPMFTVASLREVLEAASVCSQISYREAQKRKGTREEPTELEDLSRTAAGALRQLKTVSRKKESA